LVNRWHPKAQRLWLAQAETVVSEMCGGRSEKMDAGSAGRGSSNKGFGSVQTIFPCKIVLPKT
jgi:hypothetical protein